VLDIGRHPAYWTAMLRSPMLTVPNLAVPGPADSGSGDSRRTETVADITSQFDPSLDWDGLRQIRQWWPGPLLLKGPVGPVDALRAVDAGVDGFHLSNHGGRQLDGTVAAIDLVRPVRNAVGDGAVIVMDSGVRHGADIAVAVARGADMCMIGRPYLYGLAAAGPAGVRRVIDLLVEQFRRTLQLLGVTSVDELRRHADQLVVDHSPGHQPASNQPASNQPASNQAAPNQPAVDRLAVDRPAANRAAASDLDATKELPAGPVWASFEELAP
jgi:L-lactate dehydrogenase (cytochrome)